MVAGPVVPRREAWTFLLRWVHRRENNILPGEKPHRCASHTAFAG